MRIPLSNLRSVQVAYEAQFIHINNVWYSAEPPLRLTKVKLILLYQFQNYDKTLINNARSCKRMFFESPVLRKLLDIRYTLSYVRHALLNLYVYHAFNVR